MALKDTIHGSGFPPTPGVKIVEVEPSPKPYSFVGEPEDEQRASSSVPKNTFIHIRDEHNKTYIFRLDDLVSVQTVENAYSKEDYYRSYATRTSLLICLRGDRHMTLPVSCTADLVKTLQLVSCVVSATPPERR